MPALDLSELTFDPDFVEKLTIVRRFEDANEDGIIDTQSQLIRPKPYGSVLPQKDGPMIRGADMQMLPRYIQIHTTFRLRAESKDWQPDLIWWQGGCYQVDGLESYASFGRGYVKADASAISTTEKPPE